LVPATLPLTSNASTDVSGTLVDPTSSNGRAAPSSRTSKLSAPSPGTGWPSRVTNTST
jgi:hypothetical protein